MEPLNIISGAITITTAIIQSSKAVFELLNNIREASNEMKSISKDVQALYSTVSSLNTVLKENEVSNIVHGDKILVDLIQNLVGPLNNCQAVLSELEIKLKKRLELNSTSEGLPTRSSAMKWILNN
jgi:prophage DNA circulation protein